MAHEHIPEHYIPGEDSFAWSEQKHGIITCIAIAEFNIHKYLDRDKGQNYDDFKKIQVYAAWAQELMEKAFKQGLLIPPVPKGHKLTDEIMKTMINTEDVMSLEEEAAWLRRDVKI